MQYPASADAVRLFKMLLSLEGYSMSEQAWQVAASRLGNHLRIGVRPLKAGRYLNPTGTSDGHYKMSSNRAPLRPQISARVLQRVEGQTWESIRQHCARDVPDLEGKVPSLDNWAGVTTTKRLEVA